MRTRTITLARAGFVGCIACGCLALGTPDPAGALGPPRPGEIAQLKAEGRYQERLENVLRIGNHLTSPALSRQFQRKLARLAGAPAGLAPLAATLPPGVNPNLPSTGTARIFALLLEFNDHHGGNTAAFTDGLMFGPEDPATLPWDSLAAYYTRASYGLLDLQGATLGWYRTAYDRSTIATSDAGREAVIREALDHYDAAGHDFSPYDNDGDGTIDYFLVIWAGPDTGWGSFWWQYSSGWTDGTYTLDGKHLSSYTWQPESDNPHIVIHETGHALGLPDLYDYDADVGPRCGVGGADPMDSYRGDHNCFSKWMLGWVEPTVVPGAAADRTLLAQASAADQCVLVWPGAGLGSIFSEFFLVENKQDIGNDGNLAFTADGLAIWHVDATLDPGTNRFFYNNSVTAHKLVRLMEADGLEEIEATVVPDGHICFAADSGDLYGPGDSFGPDSLPSSARYDGSDSCVRVLNVADVGTGAGHAMSATFSSLCNAPPVADADGPYDAECQGGTTTLPLDGSGSGDPDPGDLLTYLWGTSCPGGVLDMPGGVSPTLSVDTSAGSCYTGCGVSLRVTDDGGLWDEDDSVVAVRDTLPPDISCPADVTVQCDASTEPSATGLALATDICSGPTVTYGDVTTPGACAAEYEIDRTWDAADLCLNDSQCAQRISVVDTVGPVIACNAAGTITPPQAPVSFTATATDNCSTPSAEITAFSCTGKKGNDKGESCVVEISGPTVTILDSGGVGDTIAWTVRSIDGCGNTTTRTCSTLVVNPGHNK